MPTIRLLDYRCHVVRMRTRFPFHYGIASMTSVPHVLFRGEFEIGGRRTVGFASDGLPPKWFTKDPSTTFDDDLPKMLEAIEGAWSAAMARGTEPGFYDWWRGLYGDRNDWAVRNAVPGLLAHLGTSLVERAGLDAVCRSLGKPVADVVAGGDLGLRISEIHPELADGSERETIQQGLIGDATLLVRHTVGLADPLTDDDIPEAERVADGLPQSLAACIRAYGLRCFKIKLSGDFERDGDRLRRLAALLTELCPDFRHTLDGNEQYATVAAFRDQWERHRNDAVLREFLSPPRLIFVEQPVHRDHALDEAVAGDLAAWPDAPPLIIDESDGAVTAVRRALELGYSGASHKNCKGLVKGIANACLLRSRGAIHSGEDLANVGPVALLQDLAMMRVLGIGHVERNGHHYFRGLGMYGPEMNRRVLATHGDLYGPMGDGTAALSIREGQIALGSVAAAPFGTGFAVDEMLEPWLSLDEWRARGAFSGF
ncbi:MAG: hypothetical protein JNK37_17580 [Verrucomicrobiales bacterium]|nr:hypothetical protein [Verrucomicrobiales bacterium]